ncbi:MAG TPA: tetratricopeptide repeat protein [Bacteroidia bacterium]|nr:tetratricopeptide repeat protein [Bacteroidia bacterium]
MDFKKQHMLISWPWQRILSAIFLCAPFCFFAQDMPKPSRDPWKNTRAGNTAYKNGDYANAELRYREALEKDTTAAPAIYNLGNSLYRQKKYDEAEKAFADALTGNNPDSLARGWHNLGNALLEQKKYQESINAYKESLRLNPGDEHARYNLAYAQKKLKQQQPPSQKQKKKKSAAKQQEKDKDQSQKPPEQKDQKKQQQEPNAMSPEEAKRWLDAMKDEEKKTREKMNQQNIRRSGKRSKEKDW